MRPHLDPGLVADAAREPLDVGDAVLRGEVGVLAVAQRAHHGPHLGERARALLLDHPERVDAPRPGRSAATTRPAWARIDDRRDVVGHGVVQLAGQLLALAQPDLIDLAGPRRSSRSGPGRRALRGTAGTRSRPTASPRPV